MISPSDLQALRASFAVMVEPGLPTSLSTDCARLLQVSDVTISYFGASDQFTLSASSAEARSLGEWEFTLQEGPCIHAAATSTSNMAETAEADINPWPRLSAKARAIGYRSIAGIPIQVEGSTFATINFQNRHGNITPATIKNAEQIAGEIASLVVASLGRQLPSLTNSDDNHKVHQATGMVMSQMGVAAETAVETLRAHAWAHDRLLKDVADDVVAQTLSFSRAGDA